MKNRTPCCLVPANRCGTRWEPLVKWVTRHTGKGVRIVELKGDEQGKAPFFAQPVGYDGRSFFVAGDRGCDTEKLMHEALHFLVSPPERRNTPNYGLGPGPFRPVDDYVSDNEEVTVGMVQAKIAGVFGLPPHKLAKLDYNCANKRHIEWDACAERAEEIYARLVGTLPKA
jgi:hypothetical protein